MNQENALGSKLPKREETTATVRAFQVAGFDEDDIDTILEWRKILCAYDSSGRIIGQVTTGAVLEVARALSFDMDDLEEVFDLASGKISIASRSHEKYNRALYTALEEYQSSKSHTPLNDNYSDNSSS